VITQKRASSIVFYRTALIRNLLTIPVEMPKNSWEVAVPVSINNPKEQWAINNNKFLKLKEMYCFK